MLKKIKAMPFSREQKPDFHEYIEFFHNMVESSKSLSMNRYVDKTKFSFGSKDSLMRLARDNYKKIFLSASIGGCLLGGALISGMLATISLSASIFAGGFIFLAGTTLAYLAHSRLDHFFAHVKGGVVFLGDVVKVPFFLRKLPVGLSFKKGVTFRSKNIGPVLLFDDAKLNTFDFEEFQKSYPRVVNNYIKGLEKISNGEVKIRSIENFKSNVSLIKYLNGENEIKLNTVSYPGFRPIFDKATETIIKGDVLWENIIDQNIKSFPLQPATLMLYAQIKGFEDLIIRSSNEIKIRKIMLRTKKYAKFILSLDQAFEKDRDMNYFDILVRVILKQQIFKINVLEKDMEKTRDEIRKLNFLGLNPNNILFQPIRSGRINRMNKEGELHSADSEVKKSYGLGFQEVQAANMKHEVFLIGYDGTRNRLDADDYKNMVRKCKLKVSNRVSNSAFWENPVNIEEVNEALYQSKKGTELLIKTNKAIGFSDNSILDNEVTGQIVTNTESYLAGLSRGDINLPISPRVENGLVYPNVTMGSLAGIVKTKLLISKNQDSVNNSPAEMEKIFSDQNERIVAFFNKLEKISHNSEELKRYIKLMEFKFNNRENLSSFSEENLDNRPEVNFDIINLTPEAGQALAKFKRIVEKKYGSKEYYDALEEAIGHIVPIIADKVNSIPYVSPTKGRELLLAILSKSIYSLTRTDKEYSLILDKTLPIHPDRIVLDHKLANLTAFKNCFRIIPSLQNAESFSVIMGKGKVIFSTFTRIEGPVKIQNKRVNGILEIKDSIINQDVYLLP